MLLSFSNASPSSPVKDFVKFNKFGAQKIEEQIQTQVQQVLEEEANKSNISTEEQIEDNRTVA